MLLWNQKGAIKMKKQKIILLASVIISIILEVLPYGAVCNFATPEKTIRQTFSYFSLTPFGYANFGPFITACLTCILLLLSVLFFTKFSGKIKKIAPVISGISVATSFMPLFFGFNYYSVVGGIISAMMIIQFIIITIIKKRDNNEI